MVAVRPRSLGTLRRKILYAKNCSALHSLLAIIGSLLCFGRAQVDRFVFDEMRLTTLPFFLRMVARLLRDCCALVARLLRDGGALVVRLVRGGCVICLVNLQ